MTTLRTTLDALLIGERIDRAALLEADRLIRRAIAYCNACGPSHALFVPPLREILPRLEHAGLRKEASDSSAIPTAAEHAAVLVARTEPTIPDAVLSPALALAKDAEEVFEAAGPTFSLAKGDAALLVRVLSDFAVQRALSDQAHTMIQRDIGLG